MITTGKMDTPNSFRSTAWIDATVVLVLTIFSSLNISSARAGQVDPRFDGQWVGVETLLPSSGNAEWVHQNPQIKTVLLISNSGQTVRVLSGFVPGRYWVEPKSDGATLMITGSNDRAGRNLCRFELSGDGNTLKETGIVGFLSHHANVDGFSNLPVNGMTARVYATFKRVAGPALPASKPTKSHT
jgi:hypothetical protein